MSMKSSTRQVDGVTIVDLSGRITLGEGSVVLRETVRDWRNITEAIQMCLQGGAHARPELA